MCGFCVFLRVYVGFYMAGAEGFVHLRVGLYVCVCWFGCYMLCVISCVLRVMCYVLCVMRVGVICVWVYLGQHGVPRVQLQVLAEPVGLCVFVGFMCWWFMCWWFMCVGFMFVGYMYVGYMFVGFAYLECVCSITSSRVFNSVTALASAACGFCIVCWFYMLCGCFMYLHVSVCGFYMYDVGFVCVY
jgi:hypothetical protein